MSKIIEAFNGLEEVRKIQNEAKNKEIEALKDQVRELVEAAENLRRHYVHLLDVNLQYVDSIEALENVLVKHTKKESA